MSSAIALSRMTVRHRAEARGPAGRPARGVPLREMCVRSSTDIAPCARPGEGWQVFATCFARGARTYHGMLNIDFTGRRALVAGVADDGGFGFAIAKSLAEAGATVCVATWPPALNIFHNLLERGKMDESRRMPDGSVLTFEKIYPLDAAFDTFADVPEDIKESKRYRGLGDYSIDGLVQGLTADFGARPLDIVVHSLANGPEVKKPLIETSREGYLAAMSVSAYSLVSMVHRLAPLMRPKGSFLSLSYMAGERVVPGYGGGMLDRESGG